MRNYRPPAIIVDMDGTLADLNGRLPYGEDQAKCGDDLCREGVRKIVQLFDQDGYYVFIVSGRFDTYFQQTQAWLEAHGVPFDVLLMRAAGDMRSDVDIKREIYQEHIEPHFDVNLVIDDRPKVIRMWRELGLLVADVGNGVEF